MASEAPRVVDICNGSVLIPDCCVFCNVRGKRVEEEMAGDV